MEIFVLSAVGFAALLAFGLAILLALEGRKGNFRPQPNERLEFAYREAVSLVRMAFILPPAVLAGAALCGAMFTVWWWWLLGTYLLFAIPVGTTSILVYCVGRVARAILRRGAVQ